MVAGASFGQFALQRGDAVVSLLELLILLLDEGGVLLAVEVALLVFLPHPLRGQPSK